MTDFSYEKKKEIPKLSSNYAMMMSNIEFCKDMMILYSSFQVDYSIFDKLEEYIREEEYKTNPIFYIYQDDNKYFYFKFIAYQTYPDFILELYSSEFFYKDTPLIYRGVSYYDIKFTLRILFMKQNLDSIPMNRITHVLSGLGMSIEDFTKIVEYTNNDSSVCDIFKYQIIDHELYYLIIFHNNLIHFYEFERYSQDIRSYSNPIEYTKKFLLEYLDLESQK